MERMWHLCPTRSNSRQQSTGTRQLPICQGKKQAQRLSNWGSQLRAVSCWPGCLYPTGEPGTLELAQSSACLAASLAAPPGRADLCVSPQKIKGTSNQALKHHPSKKMAKLIKKTSIFKNHYLILLGFSGAGILKKN